MDLKEFRLYIRTLKGRSNKEISTELNNWYAEHKGEIEIMVWQVLKYNLYRNLKRQFKEGVNIKGVLEKEFIEADPELKILRGKWARKRGANFEKTIVRIFNQYFEEHGILGYANLNYVTTFLYQPYDVCVFVKEAPPLLLECKASGVAKVKDKVVIKACNRRYTRATANKEKIAHTIERLGLPYYYVYGDFENDKFYIVNAKHVMSNLPGLYTRKVDLQDGSYLHLELDSKLWGLDVLTKLHHLS